MPLRFALICQTTGLTSWQEAAVHHLLADGHELACMLQVHPEPDKSPVAQCKRSAPARLSEHASQYDLGAEEDLSDALETVCGSSIQPDFALCFIPLAIVRGSIPDLRLGLWIWRFGATATLEEDQLGGDDFLAGQRTASAWLLMCTELSGEARVLQQGCFKAVEYSLQATRQRVLTSCSTWPARACREIEANPGLTHLLPTCELIVMEPPGRKIGSSLPLALRLAAGCARKAAEEFLIEEQWTLGVLDRPVSSLLDSPELHDIRWLPELPGGSYIADPMALPDQADGLVLAEEFDAKRGRGHICALSLNNPEIRTVVMETGAHLSYPFLFRQDGEIYCIPESSELREVRLYKAEHFPQQWKLVRRILEIPGVDCSVFRFGGLWWLLGGNHDDQDHTKLFGWYSTSIDGPWTEHPLNPLKTDVGNARPAGSPFWHDEKLYRPAQDCSKTYGGAVVINRVDELSPTGFREEVVARIEPAIKGQYRAGVHTITSAGSQTIIDGKRHYISARKALRVLRQWLRQN